jgi:isopenicillin N synthase-like dioxygenase
MDIATAAVPVIDLSPFTSGTTAERAQLVRAVADACENIGFLVIAGHGLDMTLLDRAFAISRDFFDQPEPEKSRYRPPAGEVAPRGYAAFATKGLGATLDVAAPKDLREQFMIGTPETMPASYAEYPHAAGCYAPNIWPDNPAAYHPIFAALYGEMEALASRLMHIFALGLGLPETYFDDKLNHHFSVLGSNPYPALDQPPAPGQLRTGAHTDFGSLTILAATQGPGGLQVRLSDDSWGDVQPLPGTLIINLGDMMARWTNDRWRSTLHRVVNPPDNKAAMNRRQSIAYFCHPNYDTEITCLPGCQIPGEPPRYPTILAGEHMRQKMMKR